MKKIFTIITALAIVVTVLPQSAQATTAEELQAQINALLAQLSSLQSQLATLQGGSTTGGVSGVPAGFQFTKTLKLGDVDQEVVYLKVVLAKEGCLSGAANTTYFGSKTKAAVQCFQKKYGTGSLGTVGPNTRAKLNAILAGGTVPTTPTTPTTPTGPAGSLTVSLASDTPASTSVADNTSANFTKFNLTAGSSDVTITKVYVTRSGLSANSDVENIKIVEADTGTYRGTVGSLNVDNRAMITFTPGLVIPANTTKSFYIRAGIKDGISAGKTVALGIVSSTDIVSNATAVSGVPVVGNPMTVVQLAVGTLSVGEDGTTVDSTPNVGDTDVVLNQFKLTAGSTEAVTVEAITALKAGTANTSDVANIELYDVTNNKSLGTVTGWDSEGKATWSNLGLVIDKGGTLRLKIMADIVGGVASTSKTVNADIVDGSDTLVTAKGKTYGFYITVDEGSWSGKGTNDQTINSGALNISKSSSTPATGNISAGDAVTLAVFDFDARGEEIKISQIKVEATLSGMTYDQVTNVAIYDENGTIVAGPQDLTDSTPDYATFTDTFIVPVGVHKYTVKAKIADAVSTGDTIKITIDTPSTSITAKGMTSGDTITATPSTDVDANTLTVAAGDLDLVTLTTPVAASVPKGVNDYLWATASLSAADSGEDVLVSTISVLDTTSSGADADDIDNMEIWADLTPENSSRGDVYETKVSNAENPSGHSAGADVTTTFTLTKTLRVPAGGFIRVALIADLSANASGTAGTDSHTFTFSAVTATGATSGQDISEVASGSGQAMTISTSGALTISKDATSPVADIVVSGDTVSLAVFRLAASAVEDLDVDDITLTCTNGSMVDTFYLYKYGTSTLLGTASSSTQPKFTLADGTLVVPKNNYVRVEVKAKMVSKDNTTNGTSVQVSLQVNDAVNTTGLASGAEVDSDTQNASGNAMVLYKTKPTFAAVTSRSGYYLSGNLIPSSSMLAAIFDVTANASEDVTFEADSGRLVINISRVQNDTDGVADTWTLKDQDGNVLDTASVADSDTTVTFDFHSSAFTVPAGQTKSLMVYANTDEFEDDGDTLQLYLDDNSSTNITWSINNNGATYHEADKIFRGDIYAGSFVNPS